MGAFTWKVWRIGWARNRTTSMHGWRHLVGRLWWLTVETPEGTA